MKRKSETDKKEKEGRKREKEIGRKESVGLKFFEEEV